LSEFVLVAALVLQAAIIVRLLVAFYRLRTSIPLEREEAVETFRKRSGRTRVGTTVEQLVPFMEDFPYDPSDARLISGGPVDYVIFDGLSEGEIRELVFLDVKTGSAKPNSSQRLVRRCADLRRVCFAVFRVDPGGNASLEVSAGEDRRSALPH